MCSRKPQLQLDLWQMLTFSRILRASQQIVICFEIMQNMVHLVLLNATLKAF